MKSSFCIDLQRFMLIPTKFPLTRKSIVLSRICYNFVTNYKLVWLIVQVYTILSGDNEKSLLKFLSEGFCGERGIRTPGTSRYDGFQDRCNRPLYHLSLQDDQLGFLKRLQRYDYFFFLPNIYETFFDFSLKKWLYVCL